MITLKAQFSNLRIKKVDVERRHHEVTVSICFLTMCRVIQQEGVGPGGGGGGGEFLPTALPAMCQLAASFTSLSAICTSTKDDRDKYCTDAITNKMCIINETPHNLNPISKRLKN